MKDDQNGDADEAPEPAARRAVGGEPVDRGRQQFRANLLAKLPVVKFSSKLPTEALDARQDLGELLDLDADVFLQPLEPLYRRGRE